jgi:tetratricopeptide (TPR) repeat protein
MAHAARSFMQGRVLLVGLLLVAVLAPVSGATARTQQQDVDKSQIDSRGLDLFEAGQNAHAKGNLDEALKLYEQALAADPELWGAHFQTGVALLQLGRTAEAEKSLRRATEIEPEFAAAHATLGEALLDLNRDGDAEATLSKALTLNPALENARFNLAIAYSRRSAFADVEREIALLERDKTAPAAAVALRGDALAKLGKPADAIGAYGRALALDPALTRARLARSRLLIAAGDAAGAADDLEAVYAAEPSDALAAELLEVETKAGRVDRAAELLRDAAKRNPGDPAPRRALVDMLVRAERTDEALKEVEALVAAAPNDVGALELAGDMMLRRSPLDSARYYSRAAKIAPESGDLGLKLGAALVQAKQFGAAIEPLALAVAREPERKEAHANLAAALFGANRFAEAAREFEWVAAREPDAVMTLYYLGAAFDRAGDCRPALAAFERFLAAADAQKLQNEIMSVQIRVGALKRHIEAGDCDREKKKNKEGRRR